jgi:hypothetical protein
MKADEVIIGLHLVDCERRTRPKWALDAVP